MANRKKPKGTKSARVAAKRAERLRNIGPDASGNYSPNPYAARGHVVEVAPKELRANPNSTQYPKRIVTQRMIDRYLAHGHITKEEWIAGDVLWGFWCEAGLLARVSSGYDPDVPHGTYSSDTVIGNRIEGVQQFTNMMNLVPYRCRGVVRAVVIEDQAASDWAAEKGYGQRASKRHGLERLRQGLRALSSHRGS